MHSSQWILTEDQFMKPAYRISPFSTASIGLNSSHPRSDLADDYFAARYPGYSVSWTMKGRGAIALALADLALKPNSVVTILTTSGNTYVSGCVTREIERFCQWNRALTDNTDAVLVIHEFGSLYPDMASLYASGLPIIEDYAHAFHSVAPHEPRGDYAIYSFPKYFPIQYGGVLLSKKPLRVLSDTPPENERYLKNVISAGIPLIDKWRQQRIEHHAWLEAAFQPLGCAPRFAWQPYETPSVFMFTAPDEINLPELKCFMQEHGVESSIFYGEKAFFIPLHHNLCTVDLNYFVSLYRCFVDHKNR